LLNSGSNCTAQVIFTPAAAGGLRPRWWSPHRRPALRRECIFERHGAGGLGLSVSPAQLTFQAIAPGQASAAQTVTLTNTSG